MVSEVHSGDNQKADFVASWEISGYKEVSHEEVDRSSVRRRAWWLLGGR
jgi:hypothetical protein